MRNNSISIIGAGPAGIAAAIQLKRFGHNIALFEKYAVGGLIRNANRIDNLIGFPTGITGKKFVKLCDRHLKRFGIYPIFEEVISVDFVDNLFQINTKNSYYFSDYCIIATGTKPITPQNIEIDENAQKFCYFDIIQIENVKGKYIGIIGSGDAAFDYAANLAKSNNITILSRTEKYKAIEILANETLMQPNILFQNNIIPIKILQKNEKLLVICSFMGCQIEKNFDIIIFAIGRQKAIPQLNVLPDLNRMFITGDANQADATRQISIATGEAIFTAMKLHQIILNT